VCVCVCVCTLSLSLMHTHTHARTHARTQARPHPHNTDSNRRMGGDADTSSMQGILLFGFTSTKPDENCARGCGCQRENRALASSGLPGGGVYLPGGLGRCFSGPWRIRERIYNNYDLLFWKIRRAR